MLMQKKKELELTLKGETRSLSEWAERTRIPYTILHKRVMNLKWDAEKALTTPPITSVSKDVASRQLDDMGVAALPKTIKDIVMKSNYYGTQPGRYVRNKHREAFDKWFETEFKPNYRPEGV
jgi:hypothetical protein